MNILALIFTLLVGSSFVGGSLIGFRLYKNKKINVDLIINFLFGSMVTLIAVKLVPLILVTSVEYLGKFKGILVCAVLAFLGYVIIKQIDLFIPHHEEIDKKHEHSCYHHHLKHVGLMLITSVVLYNVIEGMDIFNQLSNNFSSVILQSISYIIWNIPIGIIITYKLINLLKEKNVIIISSILGFLVLLGGIIAFITDFSSEIILALLSSVSLGMMIYMVFCELLDQILNIEEKKNITIGIVAGILLAIISIII